MHAALIIAAGHSEGGEPLQPLRSAGRLSAVERQIKVFKQAGIARIVVVGAAGDEALEKQIARSGVVLLKAEGPPPTGMLAGVQTGLAYLAGKAQRVLVTHVGLPYLSAQTVGQLLQARGGLVVPRYQNANGYPLLLAAGLLPALLAGGNAQSLAGALAAAEPCPVYLPVNDRGTVDGQPGGQALDELVAGSSLRSLHPEISVYLAREQRFMGPGPCLLLSLIGETRSLRQACGQMSISYSKGLKMIDQMEQQLGEPLVAKKRGGAQRGETTLTPAGQRLLQQYQRFLAECQSHAEKAFKRIFEEH